MRSQGTAHPTRPSCTRAVPFLRDLDVRSSPRDCHACRLDGSPSSRRPLPSRTPRETTSHVWSYDQILRHCDGPGGVALHVDRRGSDALMAHGSTDVLHVLTLILQHAGEGATQVMGSYPDAGTL